MSTGGLWSRLVGFAIIACFPVVSFCEPAGKDPFTPANTIKITYIANAGYLIEAPRHKILIDALFKSGAGYYLTPSRATCDKIISAEAPFDDLRVLFLTHGDADHFDASLVIDFLSGNADRRVICSEKIREILLNQMGSIKRDTLGKSVLAHTPAAYSSVEMEVDGLGIEAIRLRHSGGGEGDENLGYYIVMDGIGIFHAGDNDGFVADGQTTNGIEEYMKAGIDALKVDIAIVNRGMFWEKTAPGLEIMKKCIKPKYAILSHLSKDDKQGEWAKVMAVVEENKKDVPNVLILRKSMDSLTLDLGKDVTR